MENKIKNTSDTLDSYQNKAKPESQSFRLLVYSIKND